MSFATNLRCIAPPFQTAIASVIAAAIASAINPDCLTPAAKSAGRPFAHNVQMCRKMSPLNKNRIDLQCRLRAAFAAPADSKD